ncbi:MAG: thermonuclease family protein [Candidatus Daviesbacteria bacterium]|nr:thermonuclease family protein [Candidatus Daviesbacteria bacterium]
MHSNTKILIVFCCIIIFSAFIFLWFGFNTKQNNEIALAPSGVLVTKVIDGDTIDIEGGKRVRLLGVDTPETKDPRKPVQCFGKEASNKTRELLEGKRVILEKDITDQDKYGRLLRFVYLPLEDGTMLFANDYLIREGYGQVLTIPPDVKFAEQFLEAQKQARIEKKGLWQQCW